MEQVSPTGAFKSQVFQIFVNSCAEPLYAHAAVLSKSNVLRKEVEGLWKERSEKKIQWPHWSVNAAEKLLEWLYTGDYSCQYPTEAREVGNVLANTNAEAATDNTIDDDSEGLTSFVEKGPQPWIKGKKKTKPSTSPQKPLQDLAWSGCRELQQKMTQAEEYDKWTGHQLWKPGELDYEATFMTHAELYAMACQYLLDDLKNMAWQRLRAVLISIGKPTPASPLIRNLTALVHFAYQETGETANGEGEPLRMLLISFVVLHYTSFTGSDFDVLLEPGNIDDREFVRSLMEKVSQQMKYLEETTDHSAQRIKELQHDKVQMESQIKQLEADKSKMVREIAELEDDKIGMADEIIEYERKAHLATPAASSYSTKTKGKKYMPNNYN
ncbi:MAG: hypothetical protein Q9188_000356 [Gyalolechia gomerana]